MKKIIHHVSAAILAAGALAALCAADEPKAKTETRELRVLSDDPRRGPAPRVFTRRMSGEKESVTFLGVVTSPVGATLSAQLGLAKGAGLVVTEVMKDSAAAGVLQEHDILIKLDDQQLIESRQLMVLVRNHKEGDEVNLTYLRAGKQATAKVKLTKHDVPKEMGLFEQPFPPGAGNNGFNFSTGKADVFYARPDTPEGREEMDRLLKVFPRNADGGPMTIRIEGAHGPGFHATSVNTGNSTLVYSDDGGSLQLTMKDGAKSLVAKNAKGEQIFSGPVNTPEERKALPADLSGRLEKLEAMHGVSFHTDGDFKGTQMRIMRPEPHGILFMQGLPHVPHQTDVF